jgi:hypothetical protein
MGFMGVPPAAVRSLNPEINDDGDAAEKGETLLHSDELHGTPPVTHPLDAALSINDELNVTPAMAYSLENLWRISEEFLEVFCARWGVCWTFRLIIR